MGSCYKIDLSPVTWDTAVVKCLDLNAKLVDIKNLDENAFVGNLAQSAGWSGVWIGLSDQQQENLFVWTDGANVTFTSWNGGEPNGGTAQNCVFIRDAKWIDAPCSDGRKVICEKTG